MRRLLVIERALWQAVNRTRYRPFQRAWKDFYAGWRGEPGLRWPVEAPFAHQHELVIEACRRHGLPYDPLAGVSRQQLLSAAQADVVETVAASPEELAQVTPPLEVLYP